jgi:threonyl-tRNA synthetase
MLTRIYGTAWADQAELKAYLHMLEEAEKRDHRKLGREMDLFHFQEEGPGVVFWHAKGWKMFQNLLAYMRRRLEERLRRGQRAADPRQERCGKPRVTGAGTRRTCSR